MTRYTVQILVTPRPGLLDPQGKAIHHALEGLEFPGVFDVRVGKAIRVDLEAESAEAALAVAGDMGRRLLANPVTENFEAVIVGETHGLSVVQGGSAT